MSFDLHSLLPELPPLPRLHLPPGCAHPGCVRPPTVWQRWWARHEGIWLGERWYCSPGCLRWGLQERLEAMAAFPHAPAAQPHRLPLGLVLLSQGKITAEQLRQALECQRSAGHGRIGEWLVRLELVTEAEVMSALAAQQGCPLLAVDRAAEIPAGLNWPLPLARSYQALPVWFNRAAGQLYVGFLSEVSHSFLWQIESMLDCRTEPCLLPAKVFQRLLRRQERMAKSETVEINQRQSPGEMAGLISDYAEQVKARRCRLSAGRERLWLRLGRESGLPVDFLFRLPVESEPELAEPDMAPVLGARL